MEFFNIVEAFNGLQTEKMLCGGREMAKGNSKLTQPIDFYESDKPTNTQLTMETNMDKQNTS